MMILQVCSFRNKRIETFVRLRERMLPFEVMFPG